MCIYSTRILVYIIMYNMYTSLCKIFEIYIVLYNICRYHCRYSMHCTKLTLELFIENRHVIVILRLIHITGNRIAELILGGEVLDGKFAAIFTTSISQVLLIESELARLFVQQKDISMKTCTLRRSGTDVLRQSISFRHI